MCRAADCAVAYDLAGIVNPVGLPQHPAGIWRNKPVQVLHSAAINGNESVIFVAASGREPHYGAAVVDRQAPGTRSTERAQVYHLPVAEAEGVRGTVAVTVPDGAVTGKIYVTTPAGTRRSATAFTVTP